MSSSTGISNSFHFNSQNIDDNFNLEEFSLRRRDVEWRRSYRNTDASPINYSYVKIGAVGVISCLSAAIIELQGVRPSLHHKGWTVLTLPFVYSYIGLKR